MISARHAPTILTQFLGCRLNQAENQEMEEKLLKAGFDLYHGNQPPTVIILNTCLVTQKAQKETRQTIRYLKKTFPKSFFVVTGCAVSGIKSLGIKLPYADLLMANEDKGKIVPFLIKKFSSHLSRPHSPTIPTRSFIKIQEGCHQFCTFCATAYVRGPEKSRPSKEIIKRINSLHQKGSQEAILTGVNLSLYGKDLNPPTSLDHLLQQLIKKTTIPRLSLSSLTPNIINKKLANIFIKDWQKGMRRLSYYFHLSLQSGSPRILKLMNRPQANLEKVKQLIQYIKEQIPIFNVRADIIVGFPEETEEDFAATLHYIKELGITFGHIFRYSPRPKTVAFQKIKSGLWHPIKEEVKKKRAEKVRQVIEKIRQEEGKKLIGQRLDCLITQQRKSYSLGIANNFWQVKINKPLPQGKIVPVKITSLSLPFLEG